MQVVGAGPARAVEAPHQTGQPVGDVLGHGDGDEQAHRRSPSGAGSSVAPDPIRSPAGVRPVSAFSRGGVVDPAAATPYNHRMTHAFAGFWFYFSYPQPAAGAWMRAT